MVRRPSGPGAPDGPPEEPDGTPAAPVARRPTMRDVADAAGVGLATVSRVVNGEPNVNAATADRVSAVVERLGYRPNELAAHLKRAVENGLTKEELSEAITHLAFYGGFPSAISASAIAAETLGSLD